MPVAQRRQLVGCALQDVDRAVHGIGAVERVRRPTQHLNRLCLLGVDLEHIVDVAEPDRSDRHTVLQHQKRAAGAGSREYRRADRRQAFLAAAALDHRARCAIQDFGVMRRADRRNRLGCQPRDARSIA